MFRPAIREKSKLRLALSGTSGSGKTMSALRIAKGLGGKIAVLDTERGSASLYTDVVDFDVVELDPPYSPERYIQVINAAASAGYDVLILDSITHEWNSTGGILEIVDNVARTKFRGNSYAAWSEGTPRHQKFVDAMLSAPLHIITTMRSKAVYVETENNGRKSIQKQGSAPQQRDGIEYEFTVMLDLSIEGNLAVASKDRTRLFKDPAMITEETGERLLQWLNSGEKPLPNNSPQINFSKPLKEKEEPTPIPDHILDEVDATESLSELKRVYEKHAAAFGDSQAGRIFNTIVNKRKQDLESAKPQKEAEAV